MPEENEIPQPEAKPAPRPRGKLLLVIVVALASSLGGGGVTWFLMNRAIARAAAPVPATAEETPSKETKPDALTEALEKGAALPLDPFVVNLADTDAARYLRIKVSLMVDDKTSVSHVTENQALQLKLRDVILQTLTTKTSQDLASDEGKNKLRREIQERLGAYFKKPKLVDVMFTEFVIQL